MGASSSGTGGAADLESGAPGGPPAYTEPEQALAAAQQASCAASGGAPVKLPKRFSRAGWGLGSSSKSKKRAEGVIRSPLLADTAERSDDVPSGSSSSGGGLQSYSAPPEEGGAQASEEDNDAEEMCTVGGEVWVRIHTWKCGPGHVFYRFEGLSVCA